MSTGARRLLYPVDLEPLNATTAYAITRQACLAMIDYVIPVHTGPDSWWQFVESGALERVRCGSPVRLERGLTSRARSTTAERRRRFDSGS